MARHTTHRRYLAPNDVIFRTASGGVLVAAGPSGSRPRWGLTSLVRRRAPALR